MQNVKNKRRKTLENFLSRCEILGTTQKTTIRNKKNLENKPCKHTCKLINKNCKAMHINKKMTKQLEKKKTREMNEIVGALWWKVQHCA